MAPWVSRRHRAGMLHPMLQLGVLAAAMMIAGFAVLLQRRPEVSPDWPPSPPPPKEIRRDLVLTSTAVLLLVGGMGIAAIAITAMVFSVIVSR